MRSPFAAGFDATDADAELLAKEALRETFNYNRSKALLEKPTVVGYDRITLRNSSRSSGDSDSEGHNRSDGQADSKSVSFSEEFNRFGIVHQLKVASPFDDRLWFVKNNVATKQKTNKQAKVRIHTELGKNPAREILLFWQPDKIA